MISQFLATIPNTNTQATYRRGLTRFERWLSETDRDVSDLRPKDIASFRTTLAADLKGTSAGCYLSSLRAYLKWAAREELVGTEVWQAAQVVENPPTEDTFPTPLTEEEVLSLLCRPDVTNVEGTRDLAFISLLLSSGLRLSEATSLTVQNVDAQGRCAYVMGKGSKKRKVFFDAATAGRLQAYLLLRGNPASGPVFLSREGAPITNRAMQERIAEYGREIGFDGTVRERLHPHLLRHTFATAYLDATGDIDALSKLLGHSDPATTRIYTRTATRRLEAQYRGAMDQEALQPVAVELPRLVYVPAASRERSV